MAERITPNQFEILGRGIGISYSTSSLSGKPELSLKKGRQKLNFSGDEINALDSGIGTLVTVTTEKTVDRGFTTFTVLLPAIDLGGPSAKRSFRTIGVTTVHKTTIAGPPVGVQETYKTTQLRGVARQVEFLAKRTAGG